MVSRAEHRRTTLLRLGDTAIELFGKHGPGVTIDEIAKQAGVSRRTVFRYVEAKEQLAFVHSMLWLDVLDDALEELAGETMSVRERLQLASHAIATHIDDNPDPPRNAFLLAIEHPELLKGFNIVFHQWIDRVAEEVMNLAPSPTVTTVFHSRVIGSAVMGMFDAVSREWLLSPPGTTFTSVYERGFEFIAPLFDQLETS